MRDLRRGNSHSRNEHIFRNVELFANRSQPEGWRPHVKFTSTPAELLLGRPLNEEESISVRAFELHLSRMSGNVRSLPNCKGSSRRLTVICGQCKLTKQKRFSPRPCGAPDPAICKGHTRLNHPGHGMSDAQIYEYVRFLRSVATIVNPDPILVTPIRDPNDVIVLQTALAAGANAICTTDEDFFHPRVGVSEIFERFRRHRYGSPQPASLLISPCKPPYPRSFNAASSFSPSTLPNPVQAFQPADAK